jgi:hypothetical protein
MPKLLEGAQARKVVLLTHQRGIGTELRISATMLPRDGMMRQPTRIPLAMASPTVSMGTSGLAHHEWTGWD